MEYLINEKKVRYNPYNMKKAQYLGKGLEGTVYLIKDDAVKFYEPFCHKRRLSKEEARILQKIETKRILMPKDILLSKKRKMMGYSTKYIENLGLNDLLILDKEILKEELEFLRDDILLLSENRVLLGDLMNENVSFNNAIYFIDPGSYKISPDEKPSKVYRENIDIFNEYLLDQILYLGSYSLNKQRRKAIILKKNIYEDYCLKRYPDLIEYLQDAVKEDNLGEYLKVKAKRW